MGQAASFFSIIVPTYNRPGQLATCLQALARLDYPHDCFEVIVVDDGSEMPLDKIVASCSNHLVVTLLRQKNAGPAAARNTGAEHARGTFLAFTDDDCVPAPDWLQTLRAHFVSTPDRMIGGQTLNALPLNQYATASQLIVDLVYAYYNADSEQARFVASNNLSLPAASFRTLGGFDSTFVTSEDRELCDRWLHHGYRMIYAPEVIVHHAHALTLRTFWWQHFNYGRGAMRFHQTRAQRNSGHFWQDLGFYQRLPSLLGKALVSARNEQAFRLIPLLAVWQGANTAGFAWEWMKQIAGRGAKRHNPSTSRVNNK